MSERPVAPSDEPEPTTIVATGGGPEHGRVGPPGPDIRTDGGDEDGDEDSDQDGDEDETFRRSLRRSRTVTPVTRALLGSLLAAAAFVAGMAVQDARADRSTASAAPAGLPPELAELFAGGTPPAAGFAGGVAPGAGGGGLTGTVKLVDENNLYLETAQGTIKVIVTDNTNVTIAQPGTVDDIDPETTVTVDASENPDGTYTASSIEETAATPAGGNDGP